MSISRYFGKQAICVTNFALNTEADWTIWKVEWNSFFQINPNIQIREPPIVWISVRGQKPGKPLLQFYEEAKQEVPKNLPAADTKLHEVPEVRVKRQPFCHPQWGDSGVVQSCSAVKWEWRKVSFSFSFPSVHWEWILKVLCSEAWICFVSS